MLTALKAIGCIVTIAYNLSIRPQLRIMLGNIRKISSTHGLLISEVYCVNE
jgi:hypothetical protein